MRSLRQRGQRLGAWRWRAARSRKVKPQERKRGGAIARARRAGGGGMEMGGGALGEGEAAGEAAGGVDAQPLGAPPEAPLDVTEILLQDPRRSLKLPPQLLEPPLPCAQEVDDPL